VKARLVVLLLAAGAAGGCASLAERIVEPAHSQLDRLTSVLDEKAIGIAHHAWRTPDGITLAYRIVPPGKSGLTTSFKHDATGWGWTFHWKHASLPRLPVRGTVVYLSGWGESGASLLPWAMQLGEHGYRGVAVDLRGTGDSSRAPIGFGPREAGDVAALIAHLDDTGQLQHPVYLFGVSYGAATSLFAERALRDRLAGIVALEPYANAADAIRTMVPGVLADPAHGAAQRMLASWMQHRYDGPAVEHAILDIDERLDLDLAAIDLHAPLAQSQTCTLLMHGGRDTWIPPAASRSLAAAAPRTQYAELPDENHLTLPLRLDWLTDPLADWLARTGAGQCTALILPPDPAGVLATQ
jgi:pimeloyl-ACP methyl ester carboxylesterase